MSISGSGPGLHDFVCEIARQAGELQLSRYERPGEVREKAPRDVVTDVDLMCERLLVSRIEERYPEDAILSEERGGEVPEEGRGWLLDPLDGTANFSRANPLFCCCVSVVEGGRVTHTAVAVPLLGRLYHASLGGGAFCDVGGERMRLSVGGAGSLEYAFVGVDLSLPVKRGPYRDGLQKVLDACWQIRALGSAGIRGAWLAAGHLDASIGTRNTLWDYAPTALLVSEAGGRATDLSGRPWTLGSDGLLATNGLLHEEILDTLNA